MTYAVSGLPAWQSRKCPNVSNRDQHHPKQDSQCGGVCFQWTIGGGSHISAILKFDAETGEDPFVNVKSLITELIYQLQDTKEWLDKNQLAEDDELELGQAGDSEHFPVKKGRSLNQVSEVFMARIFQIWVSQFRSFRPGSRSGQISDETNRPEQSKQGQLWVRFEGKTRAVDLGGTEEEMRERIQTAIKQTWEGEVYVTNQGRRETWKSVAAMEDGRAIEVTVKMKGGVGKKRGKKNRNPWNTPSSESEPEKIQSGSSSADEADQQQMQEELQRKVAQAMEQVNKFVEVMAAVGEKEREEMIGRYEAGMPKELEEVYVATIKTAIERAVRESE